MEDLCKRVIIINQGRIVFDGDLNRVNEVFAQSKIIKLQLSSPVEHAEALASFGLVKEHSDFSVTLQVPRSEVKERSKAILDQLPVVDFNIEDIPVEEGIALLYQQQGDGPCGGLICAGFEKYAKAFELGFETALEYRINFLISLISAAYPIFIQTFLWTAIFQNSGETLVYGFTYRQMIAYTFLAGLVARIVRTGFEYEIMDDVKSGKVQQVPGAAAGLFPLPLASYFGQKLPGQVMILGILVLVLVGLEPLLGGDAGVPAHPGLPGHADPGGGARIS